MQTPTDWNQGQPGAAAPGFGAPETVSNMYSNGSHMSEGYNNGNKDDRGVGPRSDDFQHRDSDRHGRDRDRDRYRHDGRDRDREREYRERRRSRSPHRDHHRGRDRDRRVRERSPSPEPYDPSQRKHTGWGVPPGQAVPMLPGGMPLLGSAPVNRGDLFTPSRQAKRLYIGNLPPNISPFDLLNFMNAQFIASGIFAANPGPPVVDTSVANDGAYAFIELRTPQEATMSMAFDGLVFQGQALRVRRPKDYVPMPEDSLVPNVQVDGLDIVSTNVEDSPDKVFIGGLPAHLNEQDVKELLSLFGKLKAFNLVRDSHTSMSKGYAFCVFAEAEKTDTACQSLNGMKIGDKTLVVQRASTNPRTLDVETEATGLNPMQKFTSSILNLSTPLPTIFAHLQASNVLPPAPEASTVVVLLNMVDVTDDFEEDYYKRIASDARVEAETYGAVANLVIPRPPPKNKEENVRRLIMPGTAEAEALKMEQLQKASTEVTIEEVLAQAARTRAEMQTEEGARKRQQESEAALANEEKEAQEMAKRMLPSAAGLGKIFIHFESKDAAVSAQRDFAGRKYDGRMVMTSFYPEDKFLAAEF